MKNLTILIFALLFVNITAISQPCLPEGITFTFQVEIDNFQINYPNCTEIEGDVQIFGDDITNLNGLNLLISLGGNLEIEGTTCLTSLTGLENITSVEGALKIGSYSSYGGNLTLSNLTALTNLTYIGGGLTIWDNPALTNLSGLDNVTLIGGSLQIGANYAITSLMGLDNVTSLGGDLIISWNYNISSLSGLESLDAGSINDLQIIHNPSLSACDVKIVCDYLTNPIGTIEIQNNGTGCNSQEEVEADCENNCLPEGITFTSQEEIDNFQTNYPNCTELEGDVTISGVDITNLNGLSALTSIDGDIQINFSNSLISLTGLENITSIGGSLHISGTNILTSLSGLEGLTSIGEDLNIENNTALLSLTGLDNLTSIGGNIWIIDNEVLINLTGLENLTSIGGELHIGVYYGVNQALTSLTGLENINPGSISNLYIENNPSLSTCAVQSICEYLAAPNGTVSIWGNALGCNDPEEIQEACESSCLPEGIEFTLQTQIDNFQINYPGCTEIEGNVSIDGDWITNLNGLNVLTSIGGDLGIGFMNIYGPNGCQQLTSLAGLDNLTSIGGNLQIVGNENLLSLEGLENLTSVGGNLIIGHGWTGWDTGGNPSLASLTGLSNVTFVGGDIRIYWNEVLTSLIGINIVACLAGIHIVANDSLSDMTGLEGLTSVGGDLELRGNAAMTSLTGLEGLTSIGGQLGIYDNAALSNLTGLENLTYIANGLTIGYYGYGVPGIGNPLLTSLAGLNNLTSIGGSLSINENEALTSLMGLDNIQAESIIDLSITNNSSLSTCAVQSICDYLDLVVGTIEIHDNALGCNSQQEVETICTSCLPEGITFSTQAQIDSFQINYPNCSNIGGYIIISGDDIINLNSLYLTSIGGSLIIEDNPTLTDIWGLVNIDPVSIEDLYIVNNPLLSECDIQNICEYLASPNGTVNIQNNATGCNSPEEVEENCNHHCLPEGISFTTQAEIDNFQINYPYCDDIEGDLWIHGNDISNLNGLNDLTSIGGNLKITSNSSLTSLTGLNNVIFIGENLRIYYNIALSSLSGLDNLNLISSKLQIEQNHSLTTLAGLDNLNTVGGTVKIYNNDALISMEGLNNVYTIGGYLEIMSHDTLTSLSGLENVSAGSIHGLIIKDNISLASCAVESICDYLADPGGIIEIQNNAPGCNNPEEVEEACWTTVNKIGYDDKFLIYPNPLVSGTTIKYILHQSSPVTLKILDLSGRLIVSLVNEVQQQGEQRIDFNTTGLPAGIYFCVLKTSEGVQTTKMIKL